MKKQVKHPFFRNSLCKRKYLHRFEIKEEYEDGVLEVCEICRKKKFFKIIMGKLNNADYISWHFRNVLPSNHPFYSHEHNHDTLEEELTLSPYAGF